MTDDYAHRLTDAVQYAGIFHQAMAAAAKDISVAFNVGARGYSPKYVYRKLMEVRKFLLRHEPVMSPSFDYKELRQVMSAWTFRPEGNEIIFRKNYRVSPPKADDLPEFDLRVIDESFGDSISSITIDGTNPEVARAAAVLKNFDQIKQTLILRDLSPDIQHKLLQEFPNIDIIQDERNGNLTNDFYLL